MTGTERILLRLPRLEDLNAEIGSKNWVLHRRTRRIIERYGEDVVCLSPKQYRKAVDRALAKLTKEQV